MSRSGLYACDFEVFGTVQHVYFRKHTENQAKTLGLRGWCKNTKGGTVKGHIEGPMTKINEMKFWLETKGSPKSVIETAEFTPTRPIYFYTSQGFSIRRR